jgi:endonuclease VIII
VAEGDTIHRTAARLERALRGQPLTEACAPNPASPLRLQADRLRSLRGAVLERAEARGKHLTLHFDTGVALHSHLGMRGSWRVASGGRRADRGAPPWVVLSTARASAAQYGGPRLRLLSDSELRRDPRLRALGHDLLSEGFTVSAGVSALRRTAGPRPLGEVVLDQRLIAGIGNIYKSEACFAAGVSPWRRLEDVDDQSLAAVVESAVRLMAEAVERPRRRPFRVYRRAGHPCPRCGTPIRSRGQGDANRTTYWCPSCQRG